MNALFVLRLARARHLNATIPERRCGVYAALASYGVWGHSASERTRADRMTEIDRVARYAELKSEIDAVV
ncbi:MAG: hypothetical protein AAFY37_02640, partial [Pseudomonadota bacterium]